jgi:hypothetical protein
VGVFDVEHEADVGQLLFAAAVVDVMHDEDLGLGHVLDPGAGHAARHPAAEGMAGDDQAEFEFRQFRTPSETRCSEETMRRTSVWAIATGVLDFLPVPAMMVAPASD